MNPTICSKKIKKTLKKIWIIQKLFVSLQSEIKNAVLVLMVSTLPCQGKGEGSNPLYCSKKKIKKTLKKIWILKILFVSLQSEKKLGSIQQII